MVSCHGRNVNRSPEEAARCCEMNLASRVAEGQIDQLYSLCYATLPSIREHHATPSKISSAAPIVSGSQPSKHHQAQRKKQRAKPIIAKANIELPPSVVASPVGDADAVAVLLVV